MIVLLIFVPLDNPAELHVSHDGKTDAGYVSGSLLLILACMLPV
jgi:hypothetical protein